MNPWFTVAAILYLLPAMYVLTDFDDIIEDIKEWMRDTGDWYPSFAPIMAAMVAILWPVVIIVAMIMPKHRDEDK